MTICKMRSSLKLWLQRMHLWCNKIRTLVLMRAVILYAFRISGVSFVNRIYCNYGLLSPTCSTIRLNGHNSNINIMCRK